MLNEEIARISSWNQWKYVTRTFIVTQIQAVDSDIESGQNGRQQICLNRSVLMVTTQLVEHLDQELVGAVLDSRAAASTNELANLSKVWALERYRLARKRWRHAVMQHVIDEVGQAQAALLGPEHAAVVQRYVEECELGGVVGETPGHSKCWELIAW